jgi:hypothetical protein
MMSNSHGFWQELMTTDTAVSRSWDAQDTGMPGMSYTLFKAGETSVGGM